MVVMWVSWFIDTHCASFVFNPPPETGTEGMRGSPCDLPVQCVGHFLPLRPKRPGSGDRPNWFGLCWQENDLCGDRIMWATFARGWCAIIWVFALMMESDEWPAVRQTLLGFGSAGGAAAGCLNVTCFLVICLGYVKATWLILPVVIRSSQRLSHACLSINLLL